MATPQSSPEVALQVRRTFAAPREKVFAAWTEPEQLEKWMCRDVSAHTILHHQQDIRTGGQYRMEIRDPAKGETYWGQGIYREVKPPERLVFTWAWSKDRPGGPTMHPGSHETLVTVEFFARGNSTEVVLTHTGLGTAALRDDHNRGWNGCFDVLAKILQSPTA
jgi:uncharacterized protein YndB with AHSA1/START domain